MMLKQGNLEVFAVLPMNMHKFELVKISFLFVFCMVKKAEILLSYFLRLTTLYFPVYLFYFYLTDYEACEKAEE